MTQIASHVPVDRPHVAFVNGTVAGRDGDARSRGVRRHVSGRRWPTATTDWRRRSRPSRARLPRASAPRCSGCNSAGSTRTPTQNTNAANAGYANLMGTVGDSAARVLQRHAQSGSAERHAGVAVLRVRPAHQRKRQPGHGPRRGRRDDGDGRRRTRRHLWHRRRHSIRTTSIGTLENNGNDVRYETDFRSVYARVLDNWLGTNSCRSSAGTTGRAPLTSSDRP